MYSCNPSTQELEASGSLVYGESSSTAGATEKPHLSGGGVIIHICSVRLRGEAEPQHSINRAHRKNGVNHGVRRSLVVSGEELLI